MSKLWKNYSLSVVLTLLFLGSWFMHGFYQWKEFKEEEIDKGKIPSLAEFKPQFLSRTFENWQSEFLQLLTFVVLTSFLIHKGSPESKDGDEEMKKLLISINNKLKGGERK